MNPRPCERCGADVLVRYRIQTEPSGPWQLVCPECQTKAARSEPRYRYGGTWKAKRRKR
ncbi:MAG: hypothetical protein V2J24_06940 [Pseudomonadales bacterium]|nr:hypothetical protein [Pseudomonadales bacterium]